MHAVVIDVEIQDEAAARKGLADVVATVEQAPGFVAGFGIRVGDRAGRSVVVFETQEPAEAAGRRRRLPAGRADDERQRRRGARLGVSRERDRRAGRVPWCGWAPLDTAATAVATSPVST